MLKKIENGCWNMCFFDKCNSVVCRNLSQRECVGASVTSAEVKRAL